MKTRKNALILTLLIGLVLTFPGYNRGAAAQQTLSTTVFDFDSGSPTPTLRQSTPFNITSGDVTARFTSPQDPSAFSVQSQATTLFTLSSFSGNYLVDNGPQRNTLYIFLNKPIVNITLTFATIDYHDPGTGGTPSTISLTAYAGTPSGTPVGNSTAHGVFTNSSYPQGTLSLTSFSNPFNVVAIVIPYQPQGAVDFLVDNIYLTSTSGTVNTTTLPNTTTTTTTTTTTSTTTTTTNTSTATTTTSTGQDSTPSPYTSLTYVAVLLIIIVAALLIYRARTR